MKIQTFAINSGDAKTELCVLGNRSDKSPYCVWEHFHKHPYTPIYSLLLGPYRWRNDFRMCEIGIAGGESIQMWRNYFHRDAEILALDNSVEFLAMLQARSLEKVQLGLVNVESCESLEAAFEGRGLFDLIIDDSDHNFSSQLNIIRTCSKYLKPGGILIIEDVFSSVGAEKYEAAIGEEVLGLFESAYYIKGDHIHRFSGDFNNDNLLVLIKS